MTANKSSGLSAKILRKMGIVKDQKGILKRYIREGENWETHLGNTRKYILAALRNNKIRVPGILGSGWLLDIPLEELSRACEKVYLFDLVHPPQILHKISQYPNLIPVETDITGGWIQYSFEQVTARKKQREKEALIPGNMPGIFSFRGEIDAWFSVNILDQLDGLVVEYMEKSGMFVPEELALVRTAIQSSHLDFLSANKGILITDISEDTYRGENLVKSSSLIHVPLPKGKREKRWVWTFDTCGEYRPGYQTKFTVLAMEI